MICDECETVAHCMKNGCVPKTTKKDEALKLAASVLKGSQEYKRGHTTFVEAVEEIEAALAESALERMAENARELGLDYEQPAPVQQEPVAIVAVDGVGQIQVGWITKPQHNDKLYTSPPAQRTWVGLTDEQIKSVIASIDPDEQYMPKALRQFARAIESAHGIKENT